MCARMRMRGQKFNGNPERVSPDIDGPNIARIVTAELTGATHTYRGRKNAFFGPALTGLGVGDFNDLPDVIPIGNA
jgi:hypothetical protein